MTNQINRLKGHFLNPYDQDHSKFIRFNAQPGDGSGYILPALAHAVFMTHQARKAALQYAVSWREFYVGAGAFTMSPDFSEIGIHYGANIKLDEAGSINEHGEDIVVGKARKHGHQILALAVVGEPQEDHASGHTSPTLHPCGRCRDMLTEATDVFTERSTIITATPDLKMFEMFSLAALKKFHETGNTDDPEMWQFGMSNLDFWDNVTLPIFHERFEQLLPLYN